MGVKCNWTRGWASSHLCTAGALWAERLSQITGTLGACGREELAGDQNLLPQKSTSKEAHLQPAASYGVDRALLTFPLRSLPGAISSRPRVPHPRIQRGRRHARRGPDRAGR